MFVICFDRALDILYYRPLRVLHQESGFWLHSLNVKGFWRHCCVNPGIPSPFVS